MISQTQYYQRRASEYEKIYQKPERQRDLLELKSQLQEVFIDQNIIDIACGTAYWTQWLSHQAATILGIDINDTVLEIARQKTYGPAVVEFRQVAYQELVDVPITFQGLFAGFIWSHILRSERKAFMKLCLDQVETGGTLVFIDNRYVEGNSTPISRVDGEGNTYQQRLLQSGETFEVIKNFPTRAGFLADLDGAPVELEWEALEYYWMAKLTKL